jgi:hypothetical protein
MILRYSIAVPAFFDSNAVERISPWAIKDSDVSCNYEKWYWASERTLNTLRRVCRLWDAYLRRHEHRFVRMDDVVHRVVSIQHLKSTIKISFRNHLGTLCRKCQPECYWPDIQLPGDDTAFEELCWAILRQVELPKIEIIDYALFAFNDFRLPFTAFPNLVTLQALHCSLSLGTLANIMNSLPNLRHCFVVCHWDDSVQSYPQLRNITTLCLNLRHPMPPSNFFKPENWDFPVLRHLWLEISDLDLADDATQSSFWALVKVAGKNLRSLYLPDTIKELELHQDIWSFCPNLELLHSRTIPDLIPPLDHPIRTISVLSSLYVSNSILSFDLPDWMVNRTIQIDRVWPPSFSHPFTVRAPRGKARLEDASGESLWEFYTSRES